MKSYSFAYLRYNWKKLLPVVLLSFLTSVLLSMLLVVYESYDHHDLELSYSLNGNWDVRYTTSAYLSDPNIKAWTDKNVDILYYEASTGYAYKNLPIYSVLDVSNFSRFDHQSIEGRLPKNNNEILFDRNLDENVKISSKITMYGENESKEYKVVGLYRGLAGLPGIYTLNQDLNQGTVYGYVKDSKMLQTAPELIAINNEIIEKKYSYTLTDYIFFGFFTLVVLLSFILMSNVCKLFCQKKIPDLEQLELLGFTRKQTKNMLKFELHILITGWLIVGGLVTLIGGWILLQDLFYLPIRAIIVILLLFLSMDMYQQILALHYLKKRKKIHFRKRKCPLIQSEVSWLSLIQLRRLPFVKSLFMILFSLFLLFGATIHFTENWLTQAKSYYVSDRLLSMNFMISDNAVETVTQFESILDETAYDAQYTLLTSQDSPSVCYAKGATGSLNEKVTLTDIMGQPTQTVTIKHGKIKDGVIYVSKDFLEEYSPVVQGDVKVLKGSDINEIYSALKQIPFSPPDYVYVLNDQARAKEYAQISLSLRMMIYGYVFLSAFVAFFMIYNITSQIIRNNEKDMHLLYVLGYTSKQIQKVYLLESLLILLPVYILMIGSFIGFGILNVKQILLWIVLGLVFLMLFQQQIKKVVNMWTK